jgi:predicted DNA repair protein MutK
VAVLVGIALLMTVGVYGLVAGIVKLDDLGLHLSQRVGSGAAQARWAAAAGGFAPWLMKFLSVAGTAAMFLVGGGILVHGREGVLRRLSGACEAH